jgi:hypothetical protein
MAPSDPALEVTRVERSRASELRAAAERLAQCGFRIVRLHGVIGTACTCGRRASCPTPGKHPIERGWQRLATSDPAVAARLPWRDRNNLGAACGAGMGVIDLDRHRPESNGYQSLASLERRYGALPDGPRSETGGGGLHLFFRYPPNLELHSAELGPGLDFLGEGKLVVLPPSRHSSGRVYRWCQNSAPWEIAIPTTPDWLIGLLTPPPPQIDQRLHQVGDDGAYPARLRAPLEELFQRYRVPISGPHPWRGQKLWLWRDQRARCPFGGDHDAGAFFLIQFQSGAVKAACFHHSCGSASNRWREFRARYLT